RDFSYTDGVSFEGGAGGFPVASAVDPTAAEKVLDVGELHARKEVGLPRLIFFPVPHAVDLLARFPTARHRPVASSRQTLTFTFFEEIQGTAGGIVGRCCGWQVGHCSAASSA